VTATALRHGRRGGAALGAIALVALVSGCSGSTAHHAQSASAPQTTASSSAVSLDAAAKPALALVQQYVPAGFNAVPVASEYDWARNSGQRISEKLTGKNALLVACSGNGSVSFTMHSAAGETTKRISCGQPTTVPFQGNLDAVINGSAANSGVVAWRVLPAG
jgi:hypothetical protein